MLRKILLPMLLLTSCNTQKAQPKPTPPPEKKPETVVKEPEKTPETKPASTPASAPASDLQLSLVEPNTNKCEWRQVDPIANQTKVIASFDGDCRGASIAFSPDKTHALVWLNPEMLSPSYMEEKSTPPFLKEEEEATGKSPRIFEVEINTGKTTALATTLAHGKMVDISYNSKNELFAYSEQEATATEGEKPTVSFEGKQMPVPEGEGIAELVHAFKQNAGAWELSETKVSLTGTDFAIGVKALDAYKDANPTRTVELLTSHPERKSAEGALLERLKAYAPVLASRDGEWAELAPSLLVWMMQGEFVYATGKIVTDDGAAFTDLPNISFTDGDLVSPIVQGNYLLVAQARTGRAPRIYDIKAKKLLFSSDTARATIFWPK